MDISGYSLSENAYSSYTFENAIIKPHGYLLVSLKGYTSAEQNALIAEGLSLNSAGERILLKNSDGITIDCFDTGYLLGDYSSGRVEGDPDYRITSYNVCYTKLLRLQPPLCFHNNYSAIGTIFIFRFYFSIFIDK